MSKHVVLINFTEKGITQIKHSPERAAAFRAQAEKVGATIDTVLWTTGAYDGLLILDAPDDATAASLVLGLAQSGNVSTCMLRAFDAEAFKAVLDSAG